jgi:CRISPR system Cascade subunit CasD
MRIMPQAVVFTLWAPFAAMGDIAVGERRAGFDRPARSAVLGLLAAALGLDRNDDNAHATLDRDYLMAQRVLHRGNLLQDYHTVQAPRADRKARWTTRREALEQQRHQLGTLVSRRDYRIGPLAEIALITRQGSAHQFGPKLVAEALKRPAFTLYFGRKACPLGLPPAPVVLEADSLAAVFAAAESQRVLPAREVLGHLSPNTEHAATVYADIDLTREGQGLDLLRSDYRIARIERRRDGRGNRRRWQFELRAEVIAHPLNGAAV